MQRFKLKQVTGKQCYSTHKKLIPSIVCFYGEIFSVIHESYLGELPDIHLDGNFAVLYDRVRLSCEAKSCPIFNIKSVLLHVLLSSGHIFSMTGSGQICTIILLTECDLASCNVKYLIFHKVKNYKITVLFLAENSFYLAVFWCKHIQH